MKRCASRISSCSMIRVRPPTSSAEISCHKEMSKHCGGPDGATVLRHFFQLPQRNVEALWRRLGHHSSFADLQIFDFGEEVVEQSGVLAHRALRLTGGTGGEVDVRELVGRHIQA